MASTSTTSALAAGAYTLIGAAGTRPNSVTADAFARWPLGAQIALVRNFAGGLQPPAVLVGFPGSAAIARLTRNGTDVDLIAAPSGFDLAPGSLDPDAFQSWPAEAQIFYLQLNGGTTSTAVTIGDPNGPRLAATLAQDASGTATGISLESVGYAALPTHAALSGTTPAAITPAVFFSLTPDEQADFVRAASTATPPVVRIGLAAGGTAAVDTILLAGRSGPYAVEVARDTFAGFSGSLSGQTSPVTEAVFRSWPREVQRAYVEAKAVGGYPKTVIVGDTVAMIAAAGAAVDRVAKPSGFDDTALPAAARFLAWPEAAQIAYLRRAVQDRGASQPLQLAGVSADQILSVSLDPTGAGILLTSTATPNVVPAALDLNLFALWPTSAQAAYLQARGGGTPKTLLAGGSETALLTFAGSGSVILEPVPDSFFTAPGTLFPATFQGWSQGVRNLYVTYAGTLTASGDRQVTIGPASQSLTVTLAAADSVPGGSAALGLDPSMAMRLNLGTGIADIVGGSGGLLPGASNTNASTLFPVLTGTPGTTAAGAAYTVAQKPAGFNTAPADLSAATFGLWHSAIQLEYLRQNGLSETSGALTIGLNATSDGSKPIEVFIGSTGTKVYTIQNLQKQDLGKMPSADQVRLVQGLRTDQALAAGSSPPARHPYADLFSATGLTAYDKTATVDLTKTADDRANTAAPVNYLMQKALAQITSPAATSDRFPVQGGDGGMSAADKKVFTDQVNLLQAKLDATTVVSVKDINDQLTELMTRFSRANAFAMTLTQAARATQATTYQWSPVATYANTRSTETSYLQQNWSTYTVYDGADGKYHNLGQYISASLPSLASLTQLDVASVTQALGGSPISLNLVDEQTHQPTGRTVLLVVRQTDLLNGTSAVNVDLQIGFDILHPSRNLSEAPSGGAPQPSGSTPQSSIYYVNTLTFSISLTQKPTVSTDNNQTIKSGYDILMQQERQILALQEMRNSLAMTGKIQNRALDVPNLVYLFQYYSNLTGEAKIRADSEEINQTNALLKTYAVIQRLINNTTRAFAKSDDGPRGLVGSGPGGGLTDEEKAAYAMFNANPLLSPLSTANKHPIELTKGLTRPTFDLGGSFKQTQWQTFGTQLSDTVNLINQEAQIQTNSVNSQTKQKDRNFDLANNALAKMAEIVQKIANAA